MQSYLSVNPWASFTHEFIEGFEPIRDRRVLLSDSLPPLAEASGNACLLGRSEEVFIIIEADEEHRPQTTHEHLDADFKNIHAHPHRNLLQSRGKRAWVIGP